MQVAIGGIYHESNTFIERHTGLPQFAEGHLHRGCDLLAHWTGTASEIGGFLAGSNTYGFEIVPTLMAWCMPSGIVTSEAYETLVGDLVARLTASPVDGVLLSLHGAMVSEGYPDADGEILRRIRAALGPAIPLVVTIDFHANMTAKMIASCDAIIGYDTYPHVDQYERGVEACSILHRVLTSGRRPAVWLARRPLLPHILRQTTTAPPMSCLIDAAHEWEQRPNLLAVSVCAGFAYSDVPDAGFSVIAMSAEGLDNARSAAERIADNAWDLRHEFNVSLPAPDEAVRAAITQPNGLTVLADVSDNLGAGTPGDGTVLLAELLRQGARDALVLLPDPESVAAAITAGVRKRVKIRVGGKSDTAHGEPVLIEGIVRTIGDGVFRNIGPMREGTVDDQGRTVVIDTGGVLVVLTERRMPMWNLQQLRTVGIEPARLRVIVVKGAIAHRAAYEPIARRIVEVDTPGLAAADVSRFRYQHLKRPIYPLDAI